MSTLCRMVVTYIWYVLFIEETLKKEDFYKEQGYDDDEIPQDGIWSLFFFENELYLAGISRCLKLNLVMWRCEHVTAEVKDQETQERPSFHITTPAVPWLWRRSSSPRGRGLTATGSMHLSFVAIDVLLRSCN